VRGQPHQRARRRLKATRPNTNRKDQPDLPTLSAKIDRRVRKARARVKVRVKVTAVPTIAPGVDPAAAPVEIADPTAAVTAETAPIAAKEGAPAADVPSTVQPTSNSKS
jgi:hypothetical protein